METTDSVIQPNHVPVQSWTKNKWNAKLMWQKGKFIDSRNEKTEFNREKTEFNRRKKKQNLIGCWFNIFGLKSFEGGYIDVGNLWKRKKIV